MTNLSPTETLEQATPAPSTLASGARARSHWFSADRLFKFSTQSAAALVLAALAAIIILLIVGAWPSLQKFGAGFLVETAWNPPREIFGALPAIYGTLVTSAIAMIFAVPIGLFIAFFLTEICPMPLRRPIGIAIELLAGVPSIIYGIWGLFIFAPLLQSTLQPFLINTLGKIPLIGAFFGGPAYGIGIFTAGLILAIMILPFVASISRDVFATVPAVLKEAGYGLGCTKWEVFRKIVLPFSRVGVVGGCMLALGRALGETMAVTFVIGNSHRLVTSFLAPGTTISATIANEFTEADGDMYNASLIELGLLLFAISFIVLSIARYLLARAEAKKG